MEAPDVDFRPWQQEDKPALARLANHSAIGRTLRDGFPHPYTEADAAAYISHSNAISLPLNYAITVDGDPAGCIGYIPGEDVHRASAEIGYWLTPSFWGRGIATRAVKKFSAFVFSTTGIIHLHAGVFHFNKSSQRVLEKAGYRAVGVMNRCAIKDGSVIDLHLYELCKGGTTTGKPSEI